MIRIAQFCLALCFIILPFALHADSTYHTLAPIQAGSNTFIGTSVSVDPNGLSNYLNTMYRLGIALCGGLAVIMIVVGGIQYVSSDAWSKKDDGKKRIYAAVLGLMVALGSYVLLNTINPALLDANLQGEGTVTAQGASMPLGPRTAAEQQMAQSTPSQIAAADPNFTPQLGADGTMNVRSTYYYSGEQNSDADTDAGRSSTGTPLRYADANTVGVAAVDPSVIPYGSIITVNTANGPQYYVAADTGGAVKSREASGGGAAVVDFYSKSQVGGDYSNISVQPYTGSTPYANLSQSQKESFFNISKYKN